MIKTHTNIKEFGELSSLCWECINANPLRCVFFKIKDPEVGIELIATKTEIEAVKIYPKGHKIRKTRIHSAPIYKVIKCGNHEKENKRRYKVEGI